MSIPPPPWGGNEFKGFRGGEGIQRRGEEIQREGVEKGVKKGKKEEKKKERRKKEEKRGRKEGGREISQVVGPQVLTTVYQPT